MLFRHQQHSLLSAKIGWRGDRRSAWTLSIGIVAIGVAALVGLFGGTVTSAVRLWWDIPTYNYAFLILPISAYLIWRKRDELRAETPVGSVWGIVVTAAFGLIWLLSDVAEITEGRHIAFVGMVLGILLAALGWRVFKILILPFLYLWLLVPTGTILLPYLQKIATSISYSIIQWLGIPVYIDGFFLEVPSGRYHIEEGCAGLNFILASAALAPLYGYLLYHSLWKRLVVVVVALILAVIMNGVRIAGIIALAHWGGPKLNIVSNHLWYGWGFFTLVLFAAGYVGSYFADAKPDDTSTQKKATPFCSDAAASPWRTGITGLLSLAAVASVFVVAEGVRSGPAALSSYSAPTRVGIPGWQEVAWTSEWFPIFENADLKIQQSYVRTDEKVDLFLAAYSRQTSSREMISYANHIIDPTKWTVMHERRRMIEAGAKKLPVEELVVASGDQRRYLWMFYWVDGRFTADPIVAKFLEAKAKLFFDDQRAAIVAIATPDAASQGSADLALGSFVQEAFLPIEALLTASTPPISTSAVDH